MENVLTVAEPEQNDSPAFPKNRLKTRYYLFEYDVYQGKKPLITILAKIAIRLLSSHPTSNNIIRLIMNSTIMRIVKQLLRPDPASYTNLMPKIEFCVRASCYFCRPLAL